MLSATSVALAQDVRMRCSPRLNRAFRMFSAKFFRPIPPLAHRRRIRTKSAGRSRVSRLKRFSLRNSARTAGGELELVQFPPGLAVAAAVRELEQDASVEFVRNRTGSTSIRLQRTAPTTPTGRSGACMGSTSPANQYGSQAGEALGGGQDEL